MTPAEHKTNAFIIFISMYNKELIMNSQFLILMLLLHLQQMTKMCSRQLFLMPATGSDSENENYFLWRSAGDELKSLTA